MSRREVKDLLNELFSDLFNLDLTSWPQGWNTALVELDLTSDKLAQLADAIGEQEDTEIKFSEDVEEAIDLVEELAEQLGDY